MKQCIGFIVLTTCCSITFAANSTVYYCPESIQCNEENNINSCQVTWGDKNLLHWKTENIRSTTTIQPGTYKFEKAQAPYDATAATPFDTYCSYGIRVNSKITKYILLNGRQLQASSSDEANNKWTMKSSENDGVIANCYSNDTLNCPLITK